MLAWLNKKMLTNVFIKKISKFTLKITVKAKIKLKYLKAG